MKMKKNKTVLSEWSGLPHSYSFNEEGHMRKVSNHASVVEGRDFSRYRQERMKETSSVGEMLKLQKYFSNLRY